MKTAIKLPAAEKIRGSPRRLRMNVAGAVQGVGFRPHVYRLAREHRLAGWVVNNDQGVTIEVEGAEHSIKQFAERLLAAPPEHARIAAVHSDWMEPSGEDAFAIRASEKAGQKTAAIPPDLATCPDCARELFDPSDRRYRYPFLNCTHCGPRFSIVLSLPYDRANTTMKNFAMCDACRDEYENPENRRFHAQPIACPDCGPQLFLWDRNGRELATRDEALRQAVEALHEGKIVALKGLGGFQLFVDAGNEQAVCRLRERKRRGRKPFALMVPGIESARALCLIDAQEEALLNSRAAPIVLLKSRPEAGRRIAESAAPGNPYLGLMLPYSPLHLLLMRDFGKPAIATSGNLAEEPICIDEREAAAALGEIADLFLVHDRPIARHMDDSIARVMLGGDQILRRARGYAPEPIEMRETLPELLAVGGHLKNTAAASRGSSVYLTQHIGDLENDKSMAAFLRSAADLQDFFHVRPEAVACDAHPDYHSTHYAESLDRRRIRVQHHVAHALSCMAENGIEPPALAVVWDGTGYGMDGTIWGGEFFRIRSDAVERFAHLRTFGLPGGEAAVREPRRSAIGLLAEMSELDEAFVLSLPPLHTFNTHELRLIHQALERGVNTARTSSAGRLFDAAASLLGLCQVAQFEGEAAMALESAAGQAAIREVYPFEIRREIDGPHAPWVVDWGPMAHAMFYEIEIGVAPETIAAKFHLTLADAIAHIAKMSGETNILLSGGCFQNRLLSERTSERLRAEGLRDFHQRRVPPNDGGIALGQIVAAAREMKKESR